MMWIWIFWFTLQPVLVTKCDPDTGICISYYENCLVLKKGRIR
jgi:hypothetical protein